MTENTKELNLHELLIENPVKVIKMLETEQRHYCRSVNASTRKRVNGELLVHAAVKRAIDLGERPDALDEILMEVIHYGNPSDVNAAIKTSNRFIRPLHFAVASGDIRKVETLIKLNADTRLTRDLANYTNDDAMKAYLKSERYRALVEAHKEKAIKIREESLKDADAVADPKYNLTNYSGLKMVPWKRAVVNESSSASVISNLPSLEKRKSIDYPSIENSTDSDSFLSATDSSSSRISSTSSNRSFFYGSSISASSSSSSRSINSSSSASSSRNSAAAYNHLSVFAAGNSANIPLSQLSQSIKSVSRVRLPKKSQSTLDAFLIKGGNVSQKRKLEVSSLGDILTNVAEESVYKIIKSSPKKSANYREIITIEDSPEKPTSYIEVVNIEDSLEKDDEALKGVKISEYANEIFDIESSFMYSVPSSVDSPLKEISLTSIAESNSPKFIDEIDEFQSFDQEDLLVPNLCISQSSTSSYESLSDYYRGVPNLCISQSSASNSELLDNESQEASNVSVSSDDLEIPTQILVLPSKVDSRNGCSDLLIPSGNFSEPSEKENTPVSNTGYSSERSSWVSRISSSQNSTKESLWVPRISNSQIAYDIFR